MFSRVEMRKRGGDRVIGRHDDLSRRRCAMLYRSRTPPPPAFSPVLQTFVARPSPRPRPAMPAWKVSSSAMKMRKRKRRGETRQKPRVPCPLLIFVIVLFLSSILCCRASLRWSTFTRRLVVRHRSFYVLLPCLSFCRHAHIKTNLVLILYIGI